ncbi:MAG: DNRLRE domain-containing protein, partial [Deltaproteobacteria bacterium]|nr:DNRLRE domain-containing protein [Deltaproteobacteria bacterium]
MLPSNGSTDRRDFPLSAANRLLQGAVFVLIVCCSAIGADSAYGQTILWTNPLTYQGRGAIPADLRSTIITKLYFSLDGVAWAQFASVAGGRETWTGTLPVADGITGYYGATATIPGNGIESPLSNIVIYPPGASPAPTTTPGSTDRFDEVTVTLGNYRDTFVAFGGGSGTIHSGSPLIRTYLWPAGNVANRGFLRWDLSSLPADARITSATLRLYYAGEDGGGGDNTLAISVAKVIGTSLDPETATWNSPGDVAAWTGGADGGARNLAASESTVVVGDTHGWVVWDVTGMVRDWVKSPWTNSGMALDPDTAGTVDSNRYFASREHPDPLLHPELTVTYLQPSRTPSPQADPVPSAPSFPNAADVPSDTFTVSVGGIEDTYVNLGTSSDDNYFSDPLISAYTWPANNVANRAFMRWDLSGLPGNITVTNAVLWLYYVDGGASGDPAYTVSVAKVTGVSPDLSRATWNRFDGVSRWPGGKNGGAEAMDPPASSTTIGRTYRWVSWDLTEMVQDWADRPETN